MKQNLKLFLGYLMIGAVFCCGVLVALEQRGWYEADYADQWAAEHGGVCEVRNADGTRTDILTVDYAIEVDYARKWAESIGQSLHYALMQGKRPGIILIVELPKDEKYVERVRNVSDRYNLNIRIWTVAKERDPRGVGNE